MVLGASEAARLLNDARTLVLIGHKDPDGDCLGSLYALTLALKALGKKAVPLLKKEPPLKHRNFLPLLAPNQPVSENCDLIVALDTPEDKRGDIPLNELPKVPVLCIDHHVGPHSDYAYSYFDEKAPAAVLLVKKAIEALAVPITPDMAQGLYTGLLTDTNSFTNANTTKEVFEAAADLTQKGANPGNLASLVYQSVKPYEIQVLSKVLSTLEMHEEGRIALLSLPLAWQEEEIDTELFVNYARSVIGIQVAVMLIETGEGTRVNLRSKGQADVRAAALPLGGGGHTAAAGIRLSLPLEEAKKAVLDSLRKNTLQK